VNRTVAANVRGWVKCGGGRPCPPDWVSFYRHNRQGRLLPREQEAFSDRLVNQWTEYHSRARASSRRLSKRGAA
jgi:hypothetical protein